ncbi:MAG: hypothetical protein AAGD28_27250 [Bacteroidota bacterium]
MASSCIEFEEKEYWVRDGVVETWQISLVDEIKRRALKESWILEFQKELAFQAIPIIIGGMSMCLNEFLISQDRKNQFKEWIQAIIERMKSSAEYVSGKHYQKLRLQALQMLRDQGELRISKEKEFEKMLNSSRWAETDLSNFQERYIDFFHALIGIIEQRDMDFTYCYTQQER